MTPVLEEIRRSLPQNGCKGAGHYTKNRNGMGEFGHRISLRKLLPWKDAEAHRRKGHGKDEDRKNQGDRSSRNDRRRSSGLLSRLRNRFQPNKGDDGQGGTIHEFLQAWKLGLPLQDEELWFPCEKKTQNNNGRFGDDIDGTNDFIEKGGFPDSLDVEPDQEANEDDGLGRPNRIHLFEDPDDPWQNILEERREYRA